LGSLAFWKGPENERGQENDSGQKI
jgi:hypothetical protein